MGKKKQPTKGGGGRAQAADLGPKKSELALALCDASKNGRAAVIQKIVGLLADVPDVASPAAEALQRVVVRAELREVIRGRLPDLVQAITRHLAVGRVVKAVSATLVSALDQHSKAKALPASASFVSALGTHASNEDVLLQVTSALRSLTTETPGQEALAGNQAGLSALDTTLQRYRASAAVAEQVIGVWRNLACLPAGRAKISSQPVYDSVIFALNLHAGKGAVVVQAARCLQAIAVDAAFEAPLVAAGAVPALLRALSPASEVSSSANPVDAALRALRNIAALPLAKGLIVQQKGVDYAVYALNTHGAQVKVVEAAISLLWSLGHYHDIELADLPRPSIVLEALARALLAHKDDASIVAAVGGALWTLSLPDSDFARGLRAAAAAPPASSAELCALIPTLVAASKSQALSESARSHAAGALSVLAP